MPRTTTYDDLLDAVGRITDSAGDATTVLVDGDEVHVKVFDQTLLSLPSMDNAQGYARGVYTADQARHLANLLNEAARRVAQ